MVVLSPPGMMSPFTPLSPEGRLMPTPRAPHCSIISRCSRTAPWRARTPIVVLLPATELYQVLLPDFSYLEAGHRFAQAPGHLGYELGVLEVGGRLYNGLGSQGRVLGFEYTGAHEHTVRAELHHESCVGRGCDASRREVDNGEPAGARDFDHQVVRGAKLLGRRHEL